MMHTVLIPKPPLFSFRECLWFLNRSYDDCLHAITENSITKAIVVGGQTIVVTLTDDEKNIIAKIEGGKPTPALKKSLRNYITDWFDLERDIKPFYKLLKSHSLLSYMPAEYKGLRTISIPDLFEALCWSIIGQQINLTFAYKMKRSLVEKYGDNIEINGIKYYSFPKPGALATLSIEDLKQLQFSRQKADYIIHTARLFAADGISKAQLLSLPTAEKITALTALKGVGIWTANYVVMKTLRDTGGIPHGDVGLLKALEQHAIIKDRKDLASMEALFAGFRGWESYLVHYLWRSLAVID